MKPSDVKQVLFVENTRPPSFYRKCFLSDELSHMLWTQRNSKINMKQVFKLVDNGRSHFHLLIILRWDRLQQEEQ